MRKYIPTYVYAHINTHAIFCLFSSNKKWIYVLHFQLAKKLADHRALEIGEIVKYNELLYKYERRNKMASFGTSSKQSKACRQKGFCCLLSTYLSSYCIISILYCIALTVEHNFWYTYAHQSDMKHTCCRGASKNCSIVKLYDLW